MKENVIVVTGGGRGIGRAIGRRFAAEGWQVVAAARSEHELEETRATIREEGGRCAIERVDVADAGEVRNLIRSTADRFGQLDALVNCAGLAPRCPIEQLDPRLFETIFLVNVAAIYHACHAAWPILKSQGGGVIVNISSVASVDPFPGFAAYGAAKAWVNAWTKALAEEGRMEGIRVHAVAPGAVETRMLRDVFPDYPSEETLQPEEVADLVFRVADPKGGYATGETVFIRKS